jgi:predicted DCC family thiol-disulfide oxidoreductase YuxK
MANDKHLVLFDGVCNLCSRLVTFIAARDKTSQFSYVSLQSPYGQTLLRNFGLPEWDFDTVVYITGEKYFLKSTAVLHILKDLGGVWRIAWMFIIFPPSIRDFIYNIISKTRYRIFGKKFASHS